MSELLELGKNACDAKYVLQKLTTEEKNKALQTAANDLCERQEEILAANVLDLENGKNNGMNPGLLDRLKLTGERIAQIAEGLRQIAALPDCIGETMEHFERPNGLKIDKVRVPLGVIGIIYEARPNVTADAFGLCLKTGNAVILKGGSDAIHSNIAIVTGCIGSLQYAQDCRTADRRYGSCGHCAVYEDEGICGCADPKRRCGTDPQRGGEQHDPRHRDRNRQLPRLCGQGCGCGYGGKNTDECQDPADRCLQCL